MKRGPSKPATPQTKPKKLTRRLKRKTKYARRERDFEYMKWVKTQPCLLAGVEGAGPCTGVVEADHAGLERGIGMKAPDDTCIPLCSGHHLDRHACTGFFRGRPKDWKRAWRVNAIAVTRTRYEEIGGIPDDVF